MGEYYRSYPPHVESKKKLPMTRKKKAIVRRMTLSVAKHHKTTTMMMLGLQPIGRGWVKTTARPWKRIHGSGNVGSAFVWFGTVWI
eukprot:scaffold4855_cov195-Amphora_coffeaeformis.AAC.5